MAERKEFLNIEYISDHSCGSYQCGEIDTISSEAVENHIRVFGEFGYEEIKRFAIQLLMNAENQIRLKRQYEQPIAVQAGMISKGNI